MVSYANNHICKFMNINENLKNEVRIRLKHHKNRFQPKSIITPPLLQVLMSEVIQFDKSFQPVVLYANYPICILMNINQNLKMREKTIE